MSELLDVEARALANAEDQFSIVDGMRARGVSKFSINGAALFVEFFPPTAPVDTTPAATKADKDPEQCRCGHGPHEHMSGLCLRGCEPEMCAGPEKGK